jgi:dipeptidyl aminopeptidase/acylaminoacyl peptidase
VWLGIAWQGAAISDLNIQLRQTELRPYDRQILGGWPYEKEDEWRARSAVTNASKLTAPLLVQHGADDLNVPYQQIVEFVDAAKKADAPGASVTFHSYEGEKHGNQKPENQEAYLRRTAEFFCEHLMPWNGTANPAPTLLHSRM